MSAQRDSEKTAIIKYLDEKIIYWRSYEVYNKNPNMSEFYADAYETIRERISK